METPDNFNYSHLCEALNLKIEYIELNEEMKMGGPLVGKLIFNDKKIQGRFSGPPIIDVNSKLLFLSKYSSTYWKSQFNIFVINTQSLETFESVIKEKILFLESFEEKIIRYYNQMSSVNDPLKKIEFSENNFKHSGFLSYEL